MITPMLPPSNTVLALTLGTPLACDGVYLCSIEADGNSGDDDSVDQQSMVPLFHQLRQMYSIQIACTDAHQ